jgi:hypothetical protein
MLGTVHDRPARWPEGGVQDNILDACRTWALLPQTMLTPLSLSGFSSIPTAPSSPCNIPSNLGPCIGHMSHMNPRLYLTKSLSVLCLSRACAIPFKSLRHTFQQACAVPFKSLCCAFQQAHNPVRTT